MRAVLAATVRVVNAAWWWIAHGECFLKTAYIESSSVSLSLELWLHRNDGLAQVGCPFGRAVHVNHVRCLIFKRLR